MSKKIFWLAGEKSGDIHAAGAMAECNRLIGDIKHIGVGGPAMVMQGLKPMFKFNRFQVMGFLEVVKHLAFFRKVEKDILKLFKTDPPDLAIMVDYPGLNMRIARLAELHDIPVLWYICPQFWAWKFKRIYKLRDYTRHVACILPFEEEILRRHRLNVTYTGHPIAEEIEIKTSKSEFSKRYGLNPDKQWIGFFPGSREMEIKRLLPVHLDAVKKMPPGNYEFLISEADSVDSKLFDKIVEKSGVSNFHVINQDNYDMMKHCDFLTITSGTATIEAAYIGTPSLITYKANRMSYEIGKRIIKIDKIGLPNIIMDEIVFPELIQDDANGKKIADTIMLHLSKKELLDRTRSKLNKLHGLLGDRKSSETVAEIARKLLENKMWIPENDV